MNLRTKDILLLTVFLVLTFFIYFSSLKSDFTNYDDDTHISKNDDIKSLKAENITKIFSSKYVGMYQPFTTLSFAVECSINGYKPFIYHFDNLLLHLLNCLLVFIFILYLTKRKAAAYICMLLFALHPMHVESVAWVTERKDVLYTFFYLLSMIMYLKFIEGDKLKYLFLSLIFFLFSCFSKSAAITLPVILVILEFYSGKQKEKKLIIAKIPFFVLAILFGIITIFSQGALQSKSGLAADYNIVERVVLAFYSLFFYLKSFLMPYKLSAFHPFPIITGKTLPLIYFILATGSVLVIAAGFFALKRLKDWQLQKNIILDFLLFLIPILLILQVPVGSALVAERYTYMPYIGLSLILFRIYDKSVERLDPNIVKGLQVIFFIFVASLSVLTYQRVKVWKNSYTLNDDIIRKHPENAALAYNNRALARVSTGDFIGALDDINKSVQQSTNFAEAIHNRAFVKFKLNNPLSALEDYNTAISMKPNNSFWYLNRAINKEVLNDYRGAIEDYSKAIGIKQNYEKAYLFRADDWYVLGNFENAISDLNVVININPNNIEAYTKRCFSLLQLNRTAEACKDCAYAAGSGDQTAAEQLRLHCR